MEEKENNNADLLKQIEQLQQRIEELEAAEEKHKQTENELFDSQKMLQAVLDTIPQRVFWKDLKYNFLGCNKHFAVDANLKDPDEIIGKNDFNLPWKDIAQNYRDDDKYVIENNSPKLNFEEVLKKADGNNYWLRTSKVPIHDKEGNVIGLLGTYEDITQIKMDEAEMNQERILLRTLLDNIPDGIYVKDINCRKTLANLAEVKLTGFNSEEEILGKDDFDLYPKDLAESFFADDQKVLTTGTPVINREELVVDGDGNNRWLLTYKLPLKDDEGKIIGLLGIGRDITERKIAEEALQQERILMRTILDNLPDAIYVKDLECRKTLANLADVHNLNRTKESDVLGKTDFELIPEEVAKGCYDDDVKVISSGEAVLNREEFLIDEHGKKRWLITSKLPLRNERNEIVGLIGIGRDNTERKLAQEALQNEKNLLKTLIDTQPDLIFFKDDKGRYILNNRQHLRYLGIEKQEDAIGKTSFDFQIPEVAQKFFNEEMEVIRTGKPILEAEDIIYHREKGEKRWYLTSKIPLMDEHGKTIGILGVSHDITERKQAEDKLKKTYKELEKTNEDLQKANKVKGQFLANMSHEIRTPLNAVIGMTGLLLDTPLNDEQKDFAKTILNSGDILLTLINDILDFSKIEAQKIELEKHPFDVRDCVEEALDLVASKAADKDLELTYSIDEGLSTQVVGDVTRLRQILVNLLSNSIKFTEQGEVVASVSGQLKDFYTYQLHFSVRDTGIGIPPERQNKLFHSFSQVDSSTTRKFGGTGLGLVISKQLCELMGGTMWVESTGVQDEGTTFHFTILTQLSIEKQAETDLSSLEGKRVLIVDDNKTNREIMIQQTIPLKMRPIGVESGPDAINLFKQGSEFDIAVLDFQMPDMDGVMLSEELRKLPNAKKLPLILLSSYGYREKLDNNNLSNFAATLTKPIKLAHFHNALLTVLKKNGKYERRNDLTSMKFDSGIGKKYPLRILLAEDNKVNQKVAMRFLEKIGYRADVAFNGLEVLDALKRQDYDVILMDVQMPDMDGEQATMQIRRDCPAETQPRIIAMTANAMKTDRDRYLSIGMDDYIVKPFKIEDLVRALIESHIYLNPVEIPASEERT